MYLQNSPAIAIKDNSYADVFTHNATQFTVKILDINGHFIKTIRQTLEQGVHKFCVNLSDLSNGRYVLNAFSGDKFIQSIHFTKR